METPGHLAREWATFGLLAIGAIFATIAAAGIARSRNNLAALHCLGVASVMVPPAVLLAVVVDTGFGISTVKTLCFAVALLLGAPVTSHALAVADHGRRMR